MHFLAREEEFKAIRLAQSVCHDHARGIYRPRQPPGTLAPLMARDAEAAGVVVGQRHAASAPGSGSALSAPPVTFSM